MRDDEPSPRLLLIQERHQAFLERKRLARMHPGLSRPSTALEPKPRPVIERPPKPALVPSQGPARPPKRRRCADYVAAIRAIGRPCTQAEIIKQANTKTLASFSLWMTRQGDQCPVEVVRPRVGYAPGLYFLKAV